MPFAAAGVDDAQACAAGVLPQPREEGIAQRREVAGIGTPAARRDHGLVVARIAGRLVLDRQEVDVAFARAVVAVAVRAAERSHLFL
ncbi:MAG: hypothetical protein IPG43_06740 [Proteobacteria bacterium]|nr:hypothetical protein [Pseudomonadota bacterium]